MMMMISMCPAGKGQHLHTQDDDYVALITQISSEDEEPINLKTLIESDKLLSCDYDIMSELTTFIQKSNSFEAEEGCHDDLAMCLVIYAWLVAQDYFKELTDQDVRKRLYDEQKNQIEQDMAPFGFVVNGLEEENVGQMIDEYVTKWNPIIISYKANL